MTARVAAGLSLLDQVKIQSQVLLPILQKVRQELGREQGNALIASALRSWQQDLHQRIAAEIPGEGWQKWAGMVAAKMPAIAGATEIEWETRERDHVAFKITRCAYADFFRALDEPELGALLTCEADMHEVEAVGKGVAFERHQTIMQGGAYCDFRYHMVKDALITGEPMKEQPIRGPEHN